MPSNTARMGIARPIGSDAFGPEVVYDGFTTLDTYPGIRIVADNTALLALAWGSGQANMIVIQADEGTLWRWTGSAFVRHRAMGLLGSTDRTSDFNTTLTSAQTAISQGVTVPRTHASSTTKRIAVVASFNALDNGTSTTLGACEVSILRDPSAVVLTKVLWRGRPSTAASPLDWGPGGTIVGHDFPAVAGGAYTYRLCINSIAAVGGTTTLRAAASAPARIVVTEEGV